MEHSCHRSFKAAINYGHDLGEYAPSLHNVICKHLGRCVYNQNTVLRQLSSQSRRMSALGVFRFILNMPSVPVTIEGDFEKLLGVAFRSFCLPAPVTTVVHRGCSGCASLSARLLQAG